MANFREWSSEEIEEILKNEQYRLVFPLRLRKSSKTSSENTGNQTPSKRETKKKE
ncbi:MAG: hypothetical protein MK371_07955 [SAR86 cluster bacterium]|nr:hypothetical protein [SAR86 cluster bacterium]